MTVTIATLGPAGSHAWQATELFNAEARISTHGRIREVIDQFERRQADYALIPVYNTREGEIHDFFRIMEGLRSGYWIDNVVLPIHLSLGAIDATTKLTLLIGAASVLRQCEEFISTSFPGIDLLAVSDVDAAIREIRATGRRDHGVIEAEAILKARSLVIRNRELASHNRTRFAVLGQNPAPPTGYDATALITAPLKDRLGLLYDILGEFSMRGINLLDLRSESDLKTQRLQIYVETEGHISDPALQEAIAKIERDVIQEEGMVRALGSFPRVDMRTKIIDSFGFVGSGEMSVWFAKKLENEGYRTLLTGRSTATRPEDMIREVDVVAICVPISATEATIRQYGPLLRDGQALLLLAGAAEEIIETALAHTSDGVEVMLVHNLWGPQAANMKNKTASVVKTRRSGPLCSEFEAFLYKHGADIHLDSPNRHDLLMGVGQKLPTCISVALAKTLAENKIEPDDISSHSTLTSLYGILAMSRVHSQNPRTYAEIMATKGDGRKIVRDFIDNLCRIEAMANDGKIQELCGLMEENSSYLTERFLKQNMTQALAVDRVMNRRTRRFGNSA